MATAFQVDDFLSYFGEFNDETRYPLNRLSGYGRRAMFHVTRAFPDMPLQGEERGYAVFLMTAHLIALDDPDGTGIVNPDGTPVFRSSSTNLAGLTFKATIGSVQVENTKPNTFNSDDYTYWLNQTKYGRELLAYLDTVTIGVYLNTPHDTVRDLA